MRGRTGRDRLGAVPKPHTRSALGSSPHVHLRSTASACPPALPPSPRLPSTATSPASTSSRWSSSPGPTSMTSSGSPRICGPVCGPVISRSSSCAGVASWRRSSSRPARAPTCPSRRPCCASVARSWPPPAACSSRSVYKGENLADSVRAAGSYADVVVLRHPEVRSSYEAAYQLDQLTTRLGTRSVVVSGGDGVGEHPTQALLDLFTIIDFKGSADGLDGHARGRPGPRPHGPLAGQAAGALRRRRTCASSWSRRSRCAPRRASSTSCASVA